MLTGTDSPVSESIGCGHGPSEGVMSACCPPAPWSAAVGEPHVAAAGEFGLASS